MKTLFTAQAFGHLLSFLILINSANAGPTVSVLNGTYEGYHLPNQQQDVFLGIPYAKPPVGDLRFRPPHSLNETWNTTRSAVEYSDICMQYTAAPSAPMSEDCLTLNVIRPANISNTERLPVGVWIHGGGLFAGSSRSPNLTEFVWQAAAANKPLIAISINYRLSAFGFLWGSDEFKANGSANNGLRDQRLALHWIQENIGFFGGDPRKVTLFGQSAGGLSIGKQLIAYGGRDDKLFRATIMQSGGMAEKWPYNVQDPTPYTNDLYQNLSISTGCSDKPSTLECLRSLPVEDLSNALNITDTTVFSGTGLGPWLTQVDGDFIQDGPTMSLRRGRFLPVPIMYTTTTDEATAFMYGGKIDTDNDFRTFVAAGGPDAKTVSTIEMLYPNINSIGLPAGYQPTEEDDETYGSQWKRAVVFHTDVVETTSRRLTLDAWVRNGGTAFSARIDLRPPGTPSRLGSHHSAEIPYLFGTVSGDAEDTVMAELMSRTWASFISDLDPNDHRAPGATQWPSWNITNVDGVGSNIVFHTGDNGVSSTFVEKDDYRLAQTKYLGHIMPCQMFY